MSFFSLLVGWGERRILLSLQITYFFHESGFLRLAFLL